MRILVDENMPFGHELFGTLGEVTLAPGRSVDENFPGIGEFDVMAIRSVTEVTPALVDAAANVVAIGTATIGTDHIDMACIERANATRAKPIHVFSAPGSNAESVADQILYVILHLARDADRPLREMSVGIIGHGNCGRRVARRAEAFGMAVLRYDPPLALRDAAFRSDGFEETLAADFVTMHVPLTREGESDYPTWHMVGADELARMKPTAYFLNDSRGGVVDSAALIEAVRSGAIAGMALDVFEGEPEPVPELISLSYPATPHVAGYAIEAKRRGAAVIYEQACRVVGIEPIDTLPLLRQGFEPPRGEVVEFDASGPADLAADNALRVLAAATHDLDAVNESLQATLAHADRARRFDALRKNYERDIARHELSAYTVAVGPGVALGVRAGIERRLAGFGVQTVAEGANYVLEG